MKKIIKFRRKLTPNAKMVIAQTVLVTCAALLLISLPKDPTGTVNAVEPCEGVCRDTERVKTEYVYVYEEQTEKAPEWRFKLTDDELREVASVVTAEAGGEPYAGKVAVAQCILLSCEDDGIRPTEALVKYDYSPDRPEPIEEALKAVRDVFESGFIATEEPIKYFYAPAKVESEWHETQTYVMTINGHKFFKEAE